MFRQCLFITIAIALTGCASTHVINPNRASELSVIAIKQDQKVQVTMSNGQWFIVLNLQVKSDSTRWFDGRQFVSVATSDIKEIIHIRRGKGALQGLGFGLVAGIAVGAFIVASYDPCTEQEVLEGLCDVTTAGVEPAYFSLALLGGGLGGTLIGASGGSKSKYQFQVSQAKSDSSYIQLKLLEPTTENLRLWAEDILNLLEVDGKTKDLFKEYAKTKGLSRDERTWVHSLNKSDFQDFVDSGMQLKEWLMNKFSTK